MRNCLLIMSQDKDRFAIVGKGTTIGVHTSSYCYEAGLLREAYAVGVEEADGGYKELGVYASKEAAKYVLKDIYNKIWSIGTENGGRYQMPPAEDIECVVDRIKMRDRA